MGNVRIVTHFMPSDAMLYSTDQSINLSTNPPPPHLSCDQERSKLRDESSLLAMTSPIVRLQKMPVHLASN